MWDGRDVAGLKGGQARVRVVVFSPLLVPQEDEREPCLLAP